MIPRFRFALAILLGVLVLYTGRDMETSHRGMAITEGDWSAFLGHLNATLDSFNVPQRESSDVVAFIESTKPDIVES